MEVRCCCDAHLIGWIDGQFEEGKVYEFPVGADFMPTDTKEREKIPSLKLEAAQVERLQPIIVEDVAPGVSVAAFVKQGNVALKSRDYPIEQMRQIPGFREADEAERAKHDAPHWIRLSREGES